jgi:uncharacterized protein (TIGR02266 family)
VDERRKSARIPVQMWIREITANSIYQQHSANLSLGGVFLARTLPHPIGTSVRLQFTLPGEREPIELNGEVVNIDAEERLGMGVRFVDMPPEIEARLKRFFEQYQPV